MGLELELAPEFVEEVALELELAACDENWPPLGSSCESVAKSDCLRQIAGLKVLAKFLELRLNLLKAILGLLNNGILEKAAAGDSGDGHLRPPDLRAF
jgi:hypothetical protein